MKILKDNVLGYLILENSYLTVKPVKPDLSEIIDENYKLDSAFLKKERTYIHCHHEIMHYYNATGMITPKIDASFYQKIYLEAYKKLNEAGIVVVIHAMNRWMVFLPTIEKITPYHYFQLMDMEQNIPKNEILSDIVSLDETCYEYQSIENFSEIREYLERTSEEENEHKRKH